MREPAIPVTVVTGFLGAGKTTLLNRLLKEPALADAAVIINEFGSVGLDHLLVEAAGEDVVLLASGCLCCTMRGEFVDTLAGLHERRRAGMLPPFRRVLIETSGLADPAPILQTLIAHESIAGAYRLDAVVTVVDALHGEATLAAHRESLRQIAVADRLLLAKAELVDSQALGRLQARLVAINPAAPILDAGQAGAGAIIGAGPYDPAARPAEVRAWLATVTRLAFPAHRHFGEPAHRHDVGRHSSSIRAFSLISERPIPAGRLEGFLDLLRSRHGKGVLRFKAIVALAGEPDRPVVLQGVRHVLAEPVRLAAWPGPERASRLVFIVEDVEPAEIEALFAAIRGEPRLDSPDFAALADNPLALR